MGLGMVKPKLWLDPGIGFAKNAAQSAALVGATATLVETGHPVLVGPSRKSFISALANPAEGRSLPPSERLPGTLAAITLAVAGGARAVRVHDIAAVRQALRVTAGCLRPSAPSVARPGLADSPSAPFGEGGR